MAISEVLSLMYLPQIHVFIDGDSDFVMLIRRLQISILINTKVLFSLEPALDFLQCHSKTDRHLIKTKFTESLDKQWIQGFNPLILLGTFVSVTSYPSKLL
ncbi:hypothetical protein YC2023_097672 [Brassica napus]